jgi:hypothetical protein
VGRVARFRQRVDPVTSRLPSKSAFDQFGGLSCASTSARKPREPQNGVAITMDWSERRQREQPRWRCACLPASDRSGTAPRWQDHEQRFEECAHAFAKSTEGRAPKRRKRRAASQSRDIQASYRESIGRLSRNPELPHLGNQRCPQYAEPRRRASLSTHGPIGLPQDRDDVRSVGIRQRA